MNAHRLSIVESGKASRSYHVETEQQFLDDVNPDNFKCLLRLIWILQSSHRQGSVVYGAPHYRVSNILIRRLIHPFIRLLKQLRRGKSQMEARKFLSA